MRGMATIVRVGSFDQPAYRPRRKSLVIGHTDIAARLVQSHFRRTWADAILKNLEVLNHGKARL